MATDDVTTMTSACLCGKGSIEVIQTMPDHPYVRASQIHYGGVIKCPDCSELYMVENGWSGSKPRVVRKVDVEARSKADAAVRKAEADFKASDDGAALIPKIIDLINKQPTMAAKHRLLLKLRLSSGSYSTYIKGPTDGKNAVRFVSGASLAHIGMMADFPDVDKAKFDSAHGKIRQLQEIAWSTEVPTVTTGATWMAA